MRKLRFKTRFTDLCSDPRRVKEKPKVIQFFELSCFYAVFLMSLTTLITPLFFGYALTIFFALDTQLPINYNFCVLYFATTSTTVFFCCYNVHLQEVIRKAQCIPNSSGPMYRKRESFLHHVINRRQHKVLCLAQ